MENICLLNNNVAICRSDMPSLHIGQPRLSNQTVENALFELMAIKRWLNMAVFLDKWAPYGLPWYSDGGILWDGPNLKQNGKRQLSGSVSQARKKLSLKNASDLQPIIARYEEQLDLARRIGAASKGSNIFDAINDEFDMRLKAVDAKIDQSSSVIGIEELLAHRTMLILACKLYKGFLRRDFSDELFARANMHKRKDGQIQVSFPCEELYENAWIRSRYYDKTLGDRPSTLFMENMLAWEALSLEADLNDEIARKSFFVICPESITNIEDAMRHAAGAFAAAIINENTADSKEEEDKTYVNRDLNVVSDVSLIWQIWEHLGRLFNDRTPISECAHCRTPIPATTRQAYCSDACKTAASKKRKDLAMDYARSGRPLDEAVDTIGERYRANVERWYEEADGGDGR